MIPNKMPGNDIFTNGLRERIAACRKRLRSNRVTRDTQVKTEPDEVFPKTITDLELHPHTANFTATRVSVVLVDYSSLGFESTQPREGESLLLVGEQEVGIT